MQQTSGSGSNLAYAAGVVDSDGSIGVRRSTYAMRVTGDAKQAVYSPRVMVKQVTPEAVTLLHDLLGGHLLIAQPSLQGGRPLHVWEVHSALALRACEALLPYLRIKREQAHNAIAVGRINASPGRRRHDIPPVVEGEPLLSLPDAARAAGKSYEVAHQCVRLGNIPTVRKGRRIYVPASYITTWRTRPASNGRRQELTDELERLYLRAKELNRVGI